MLLLLGMPKQVSAYSIWFQRSYVLMGGESGIAGIFRQVRFQSRLSVSDMLIQAHAFSTNE